jgi:hypothetical protein
MAGHRLEVVVDYVARIATSHRPCPCHDTLVHELGLFVLYFRATEARTRTWSFALFFANGDKLYKGEARRGQTYPLHVVDDHS